MKRMSSFPARAALLLLMMAPLLFSCVPQKKIRYLQLAQEKDTTSFNPRKRDADYRIQSRDNLYIRIYTLDEKASQFFNKQSGASSYNDYANEATIYLNSYMVNAEGYIDFPVVGRVQVRDLTTEQIKVKLQELIGEYLKETMVVVKLVNFRVTVLGEVFRPGQYPVYQDELNIFEALSLAGDVTEFANRNKVALVRQVSGGSKVYYLDLTDRSVLGSPQYYLQPGDIVYVAPLGYKRWGLGSSFPWAIVLASVSTTLLLINFFK